MPITSESLVTPSSQPEFVHQFRPWQPRRWSRHDLPIELNTVVALNGEPIIPLADLAYLLNARSRDLLEWRHPQHPR